MPARLHEAHAGTNPVSEEPDSPLEAFRRLLGTLPAGPGAGIELLISQLPPEAAVLLRLGAIPHSVDRRVAAVLRPLDAPIVPGGSLWDVADLTVRASNFQWRR